MAKLSATLLSLALLAATAQAAPAPRPKPAPTAAQMKKVLLARGIVVKAIEQGREGEWVFRLELSVVTDGRGYRTAIDKRIRAAGDRAALLALVESGKDAARLREEDAQERQQVFNFYTGFAP
jgi:hypothetical protein